MGRAAKGRSIANLLELRPDEKIAATIRIQGQTRTGRGRQTWNENLHIVFATRTGIVKKSNLTDFKNIRKGGIIAIKIEEGDRLIDAKLTTGHDEIVLITQDGMSIRFHEEELRDQGRDTVGVWGIRPDKGDYVVGSAIVNNDAMLLVAGENGIGKRTPFDEYRLQSRGGKGIITMKTTDKTGGVVGALTVRDADELMLITTKGQMVRTRVERNPRDRPQRPGREAHRPEGETRSSKASPRSSARRTKSPLKAKLRLRLEAACTPGASA